MTRDEAVEFIKAYFRTFGVHSPGLNEQNLGAVSTTDGDIYFEYLPGEKSLKCSALIYKFHHKPDPKVIESFELAESEGNFDTGGGFLEYEAENIGIYLSRNYEQVVPTPEFSSDLARLLRASIVWGETVLELVASQVNTANQPANPGRS